MGVGVRSGAGQLGRSHTALARIAEDRELVQHTSRSDSEQGVSIEHILCTVIALGEVEALIHVHACTHAFNIYLSYVVTTFKYFFWCWERSV
jgi:hypothetical protein